MYTRSEEDAVLSRRSYAGYIPFPEAAAEMKASSPVAFVSSREDSSRMESPVPLSAEADIPPYWDRSGPASYRSLNPSTDLWCRFP